MCRLKITDNRQVVGKSVIPLHICQDLGRDLGVPLPSLVKPEAAPGVLGSAGSAHATQVKEEVQLISGVFCKSKPCPF